MGCIQQLGLTRLDLSLPQRDKRAAWGQVRHLMIMPGSQHSRALSLCLLALAEEDQWRPVVKGLQQQDADLV